VAPRIEVTNSLIVKNGMDGSTTFFDVAMKGSFRAGRLRTCGGGGAAAGGIGVRASLDSTSSFRRHLTSRSVFPAST
jgi:hypothetical protein